MRKIAIIGVSMLLTACATPEQTLTAHIDSNLDAMVGQPVHVAVERLGQPSSSGQTGSDKIYSWQEAFESTIATIPLYGFTAGSKRTEVLSNECLIQAVVSPDGLIRRWHFQGNYAGCRSYAERLVSLAQVGAGPTVRIASRSPDGDASGRIVRAHPKEGPRISYPRRHLLESGSASGVE